MTGPGIPRSSDSIDDLLAVAVEAQNRGDVATARDLATRVLATDAVNRDASDLLAADPGGELRRASLLFADLVGSTAMSARLDPERYRTVVRRYQMLCRRTVEDRYGGHVSHVAGDGLLAVFGLPTPHENDVERAVRAGLDIVAGLAELSEEVAAALGERLEGRAAVHRGLVYLDVEDDEIYGLAANVVARLQEFARPGTVIVSDEVCDAVGTLFETAAQPARPAKGIDVPLRSHLVVAERPPEPARGRRWAAPLVNRTAELAALRARWRDAREGTDAGRGALHVVGEAGIGKSRLVALLAEEARAEGGTCVSLLTSPFHADASFHAVRTMIEGRSGAGSSLAAADRLAQLRRELSELGLEPDVLIPPLAAALDISPEAGFRPLEADARKLHDAIVDAAARYMLAAIGPGPGLCVVEDLHWCDDSTLDVIANLLRSKPASVLVVTTSRDPAPAALGPVEATIPLPPLDDDAAGELVRLLAHGLDRAARRALVDRADGVPLFLEELAHGASRPEQPVSVAAQVPAGPTGEIPEALYEPLVSRLYATGAGMEVVAAAATIGREVDHGTLARVVELPDSELKAALRALLGGLILERALDGDEGYRFRHELLRDVAYDLQPPSRRRELHRRVATALTEAALDADAIDWHVVASHHEAAGQVAEAVAAYQRAADGARRRGALGAALGLLSRAVELAGDLPDDPAGRSLEVGLRLRRGFLASSVGGNASPDVMHDYERCLELALDDIRGDEMFSTLIALYGHYMVRGDLVRALEVAELLRAGLAGGREPWRPDNDAAFGTVAWFGGDFPTAHERLEAAVVGIADREATPDYGSIWFMHSDAPAAAHMGLALARFMRGDAPGAHEQMDAARRRCSAVEFPRGPFTAALAEMYTFWMLSEIGDLDGAVAATTAVTDIAGRHGFDAWALVAATLQAMAAGSSALETRPVDRAAVTAHAQAVEGFASSWKLVDLGLFLPFVITSAGRLRAAAGDVEAAAAHYDEVLELSSTRGLHFYDAEVMRLQAQLMPHDAATALLRDALHLARAQGAVPFERRIAGDIARARSRG
jgi:class 3 adenylate cyclase/tetratricopeptide (TPR) repeat protein